MSRISMWRAAPKNMRKTMTDAARRGCAKVRYRNRVDALIALARIQFRDKPTRAKSETRVYRCERCYGYHLTSKPYRPRRSS